MPFVYTCDCDGSYSGGGGGNVTVDVQAITDEEIKEICNSLTAYTAIGEAALGTTMI